MDPAELETRAKARFVRFDAALWRDFVAGPAERLARALSFTQAPEAAVRGALRTFLELGCEAIGLGYLYPASAGREGLFPLAFHTLIPEGLAALPPASWGPALAHCWNLGENLETAPAWLRRLFTRRLAGLRALERLEAEVAEVTRLVLEPPAEPLGARGRPVWVPLADEDPRFLPGAMHFLAPTVLCVHDRLRQGGGGRDAEAQAVWLATERPLLLGAVRCGEQPALELRLDEAARVALAAEPLAGEAFAAIANQHRAGVALETSQRLLAVLPA